MPSKIVMKLRELFVIPRLIEEEVKPKSKHRGKLSKTRMDKPRTLCYARGKPIRKVRA